MNDKPWKDPEHSRLLAEAAARKAGQSPSSLKEALFGLVMASAVIAFGAWLLFDWNSFSSEETEIERMRRESRELARQLASEPDLKIVVSGCEFSSGYLTTEGYVENTGHITVNFVTARTIWLDRSGRVVDTGSTYAVGREQLRPGERSSFRDSTRSPHATRCNASLQGYRVP